MKREYWNRCDVCGKFIALRAFENGAVRHLFSSDSDLTKETYETICINCNLGIDDTRFFCFGLSGM